MHQHLFHRPRCDDLVISEKPLNTYGSLESMIRSIRDHRPLDLSLPSWRSANPHGDYATWREAVHTCLIRGLSYDAGPVDLQAETLSQETRDGYILERIRFTTAPWLRLDGYFLLPSRRDGPVPGMVAMHAWGGPMLWGKDRIVDSGRDHPILAAHRAEYYDGRYLAVELARRGYAVVVIDNHHFGPRAPRGIAGIPHDFDPFTLTADEAKALNERTASQLYLGLKQLMWAGTTWAGLNLNDDRRCVDYLCSRPEVDASRIGCTGLSGGGWRTNLLAALEPRLRASVSVGWMTTGDYQQLYNLNGAVGTFCLLPGVWNRLDLPDIPVIGSTCATMVVVGKRDILFPNAGVRAAVAHITDGFAWAGRPEHFCFHDPDKPHAYDSDVQAVGFAWLDRWLKN